MFRITPDHTEMGPEELTKRANDYVTKKHYKNSINDPVFKLFLKIFIFMLDTTVTGAIAYKKLKKIMVPTYFSHEFISTDKGTGEIVTTSVEIKIICKVLDKQ